MKKTSLFNSVLLILIVISCLFYIVYDGLNLKGMTSLIFLVLGFVNLLTVKNDANKDQFIICLFIGLVFAFFADILIEINMISGFILYYLTLTFMFVSFCKTEEFQVKDIIYSFAVLIPCIMFILYTKKLDFGSEVIQDLSLGYAVIFSGVIGKSISNFISNKSKLNLMILVSCLLLFTSNFCSMFVLFAEAGKLVKVFSIIFYYCALTMLALTICYTEE